MPLLVNESKHRVVARKHKVKLRQSSNIIIRTSTRAITKIAPILHFTSGRSFSNLVRIWRRPGPHQPAGGTTTSKKTYTSSQENKEGVFWSARAARRRAHHDRMLIPDTIRRTGITLKDTGIRDEYGLEPVSGIFSSPVAEPSPQRNTENGNTTLGSDDMVLAESIVTPYTCISRNPLFPLL